MIKPRTRALLALFAAIAALAGGELALTPASAPALIAEECEPNEPGTCGPPEEGTPGGEPGEGQTQPGEVIVVEDTKPKEPEEKPVKTSSPDLRTVLADTGGRGGQSGWSDPYEIFTRQMGCGNYMQAFQEAAASAQKAPAGEKKARAQALQEARIRYASCQRTNFVMTGSVSPGECTRIRRERDAFQKDGDDLNAGAASAELALCRARDAWAQEFEECESHPGRPSCQLGLATRRRTLYLLMEGYFTYGARSGWRLGFKDGLPWWYPVGPRG